MPAAIASSSPALLARETDLVEARLLPFVRALELLERGAVLPPRVTGLYEPSRVVEVLPDTLRAGARSCGFPDVGIRPTSPRLQ